MTNFYIHSSLALERCSGFTCKWTVDKYELDLTPFQFMGINLTATDKNQNVFYFSPCNNLLSSTGTTWQYMAVEVNNHNEQKYLARYDEAVSPVIKLDADGQPIWHFQYNENFSIEYICDYDISSPPFMQITQIIELYPNAFILQISSYYICDNVTISDELNKNQCRWYDETSSNVLDLRPLYGESISRSSYYLYVCQNSAYRMSGICGPSGIGCCAMYTYSTSNAYGIFNSFIQPLFDSVNNEWTFDYKRYANSITPFVVRWICNPEIGTYSVLSASNAEVQIQSAYACPAEMKCIFIDGENAENVLDLTGLYGELIRYYVDEDDTRYSFEYTVCRNNIVCNGSISTMAMRWNIYKTKCDPYLAIWAGHDGYHLSYNDDLKQWKFTYFNGESCKKKGWNTEFNIYWNCNQAVTNWNVTSVESINECQYAMYIDSSHLC